MQAHVVTAPGDGVAPAVLLSLPASGGPSAADAAAARQPPAQYLFNVPEGFARLVLEHKLRPGERCDAQRKLHERQKLASLLYSMAGCCCVFPPLCAISPVHHSQCSSLQGRACVQPSRPTPPPCLALAGW